MSCMGCLLCVDNPSVPPRGEKDKCYFAPRRIPPDCAGAPLPDGFGGRARNAKIFEEIRANPLPKVRKSGIMLSVASADVAQQVERILGKDEVTGSNPVISSN